MLRNDLGATAVVRHTRPVQRHGDGQRGRHVHVHAEGRLHGHGHLHVHGDRRRAAVQGRRGERVAPSRRSTTVAGPNGTTTKISGEGFGSSLAPVPGRPGYFYGLTDRGPNADAPDGNKSEMVLELHARDRRVQARRRQGRAAQDGHPEGAEEPRRRELQRPPAARHDRGDRRRRRDQRHPDGGKVTPQPVAKDPYGYDSEGLVALPDGTFWVSDEYGPYITHFDANGYELGRLTPYKNSPDNAFHKIIGYLPAELADRLKNKGMEGLTVTPDGSTLVGVMQSALQQPDLGTHQGQQGRRRPASSRSTCTRSRPSSTSTCSTTRRPPATPTARSPRCRTRSSSSTSGTATSSRSRTRRSTRSTSTAPPTSAA